MREQMAGGYTSATSESSHCVHVEVDALEPDTEYFYQFETLGERSPVGRTHTLPAAGSRADRYDIALVSCQDYSAGYFTAYRDIVERRPDLVIHLGDYIYESAGGNVRPYPVEEAMTLQDYRSLYTQFRLDSDLQDAHSQFPWMLIWDDHEVVNDWGPNHYLPSSHNRAITDAEYQIRKRAAMQAYLEYMPVRRTRRDPAGNTRIYGRTVIGDLIELNRLDVRSYRDTPVCDLDEQRHFEPCEETRNPERSLLGAAQENWLIDGLGESGAQWNCLVQATVMAPLDVAAGVTVRHEADSWDNYEATRNRIADAIVERRIENVVSLGGNIHSYYAGVMFDRQERDDRTAILTEVVTTSVTAGGGDDVRYNDINGRLRENPGIQYFENRFRGYVWLSIEPSAMEAELRVIDDLRDPRGIARTLTVLHIESGKPGVVEVEGE